MTYKLPCQGSPFTSPNADSDMTYKIPYHFSPSTSPNADSDMIITENKQTTSSSIVNGRGYKYICIHHMCVCQC